MTPDRFVTTTRSRKYLYGAAVLALLILGSVAAIATAPRALTWSVPIVTPSVVAGGAATTTTVSLVALDTLPNALVQVSPSLIGLVSVSPTDLATIPKGRAVTLTLTSSAPASGTPGVVQGYIQIVKENPNHQVYGTPLQIGLKVTWPTVSDPTHSYTISYPPAFVPAYDPTYNDLSLQPPTSSASEELTGITVSTEPNPQNLSVTQYFNGTNGPDLIGQSLGAFTTTTLPSGALAYTFDPVVTFAGGLVVVVPRAQEFVVVTGQGVANTTVQMVANSLVVY
jgi:hypothetical protein